MTIKQAKYKQVNADGSVDVFHFQTNADIVVDGTVKKVPAITDIQGWDNIKSEVETARNSSAKAYTSLDARFEDIDLALKPAQLLSAIKTVDGANSGLDADTVDGVQVNDASIASATALWTSFKVQQLLDAKFNADQVTSTATANKVLRLNGSGLLPAGVTGNSATATKLATARAITLEGDVTGSTSFDGSGNVAVTTVIDPLQHDHTRLTGTGVNIVNTTATSGNIQDFQVSGATKSSIDSNGNFTGKAATATKWATPRTITMAGDASGSVSLDGSANATLTIDVSDANSVDGKHVDDTKVTNGYLWTAAKILDALGGTVMDSTTAANGWLTMAGVKIAWGTVDMASKTLGTVTFPAGLFTQVPWAVLHGAECADTAYNTVRQPGQTTITSTKFLSNKSVAVAKINWVAIGI